MIYDGHLADNYQTQNSAQLVVNDNTERSAPFSFSSDNARSQINIHKFVDKLKSISGNYSTAKCAKSVRIALQSAGAKIVTHPIAASDWGDTLTKIGYKQIQPAFDHPQKGDIYIIKRTANHVYGHIAGYSGTQWISDFKQASYDVYKDTNVTYKYYRLL